MTLQISTYKTQGVTPAGLRQYFLISRFRKVVGVVFYGRFTYAFYILDCIGMFNNFYCSDKVDLNEPVLTKNKKADREAKPEISFLKHFSDQ
jgi:hypothetical protein